jgi:hypothetical protein
VLVDVAVSRQQPNLRRLGAERALHDRSADQRPIGWRIAQAPVPVGHIKHRRSHSVAFVRHHAKPASPGQWWWHNHHHVVRRDRERYDLVDDRRDLAAETPRAVRGRLLACLEHCGGDQHQRCVRHLPLGLGLLHQPGLQRRHRPDPVLRRACWTGYMVRRWHADPFGFLRPWARSLRSWPVRHLNASRDRHGRGHLPDGVASNAFSLSKLTRDRLQGLYPGVVRVVERAIQLTPRSLTSRPAITSSSSPARPLARSRTWHPDELTWFAIEVVE